MVYKNDRAICLGSSGLVLSPLMWTDGPRVE